MDKIYAFLFSSTGMFVCALTVLALFGMVLAEWEKSHNR